MISALVLHVLLGAEVAVTFAPDQPLPIVYVDEPLILEMKSDADVEADASLTLSTGTRPEVTVQLGTVPLRAGAARWRSVEGLPPIRGHYDALLRLQINDEELVFERTFCRIDRPSDHAFDFVAPFSQGLDMRDARVLRTAPFGWSGLPLQGATALDGDVRYAPLPRWIVHVTEVQTEPETMRLAFPEAAWWVVDVASSPEEAFATARTIDENRGQTPLALYLDSLGLAGSAVENGMQRVVSHWSLPWPDAGEVQQSLRRDLAAQGVETVPWIAHCGTVESGAGFVRLLMDARRADARLAEFPFETLYQEGALQPAFPYACALAHRLSGARYIGGLDVPPPYRAEVFLRNRMWTLVVWTSEEASDIRLQAGEVNVVAAFDALNNPTPFGQAEQGELPVAVSGEPRYIEGSGGTLIAQAARYMARLEAEALIDSTEAETFMPETMWSAIELCAADNVARLPRRQFLLLLQAFPQLEQRWQREAESRPSLVAVTAGLARLLRHLSVVEQESGDVFLEPYTDLLARADEMAAQYVTGQTGDGSAPSGRAEWLFGEITRLGDEARQLAASGRSIEADAVASLTEWRARALRHAMAPAEAPPTAAD